MSISSRLHMSSKATSIPTCSFYAAPHRSYRARVLGLEGGNPAGLAALLVEGKIPSDLVALPLDHAASVSGGEPITLIGFPRAEGSMWTVTTGTLSGRRGSALSFSGTADEGNSGGPVLFQGGVVGIVTQVGAKFNTAVPAVVARFALEGWGVRLTEEAKWPPTRPTEEKAEPVSVQPTARGLVSGTYQGLSVTLLGGTSVIQTAYQQNGDQVTGTYADNHGDAGVMQGQWCRGMSSPDASASQIFQGVACDFTSEVAATVKNYPGHGELAIMAMAGLLRWNGNSTGCLKKPASGVVAVKAAFLADSTCTCWLPSFLPYNLWAHKQ